jgi:phosphoglycerol transferase MdoB-like AlkP superfamily enzyme
MEEKMKNWIKLLLFLIKYLAFWVALFGFFRVFFILYNYKFSTDLSFFEILQTFRHGFAMDLAMATYLCFFPVFICTFSPVVRSNILYRIIFIYSMIILIVVSILGLFDIGLYADWGTRLSTQILPALEHPKGMLACVTYWQLIVLLMVEIGVVAGSILLYHFLFKTNKKQTKQKWWSVPILITYGALLIIPMRGGLHTTPINLSSVYFSANLYANHAAINPHWSFFNRLIYSETDMKRLAFMEDYLCDAIMQNTSQEEELPTFIKSQNNKPINVIVVILESFSNKVIESLGGAPNITPNFNKLAQEGILFNNFYATGDRSDKGIAALLASYPAMVGPYSILHFPEKIAHLDFLSKYFMQNNYETHFYYAGEVDFYNTKALVLHSEYDHLISVKDFPASARQQKWGVPDRLFYKRIIQDIETFSTPFFLATYSISSHSPYDIPDIPKKNYENAIRYSDQCLGEFVTQLKQSACWDNTLLILTSDHGVLGFSGTSISNPLSHKIPMLWIGGVIDTAFVHETMGMQPDLSTTLVQQLGWKPNANPFSKNLFGSAAYALYFNTNGYGFISPDLAYYNNLEAHKIDLFYVNNEQKKDSLLRFSEAFVQFLHADFKRR